MAALLTLDELKDLLGKTNVSDTVLQMYIDGISEAIQGTGTILATDYTEEYHGTGTQDLVLNHRPINSVSSLKMNNADVTDYKIMSGQGVLYRDYGWPLSGSNAPMMHDRMNVVYNSVEVTYNAGYANVPSDLKLLVYALIRAQMDYDAQGNLTSYKISDVAKTWGNEIKKLSPQYQSIWIKYKGLNL